jgi:VanZ family protein
MSARHLHLPDGPWIAALVALVFGTIDEAGQLFVPGRAVELSDWAANVSGAFAAIAATAAILALANLSRKPGV